MAARLLDGNAWHHGKDGGLYHFCAVVIPARIADNDSKVNGTQRGQSPIVR
jgi:hypothetical protein